jgi:Asp-tRNA(Asn)/Glu-tRNA(Gln) amidotransferase A subunit family amidase
MKASEGIPVGIQVSTLPYEDEKCIAVSKVIEKLIPFKETPLLEPRLVK